MESVKDKVSNYPNTIILNIKQYGPSTMLTISGGQTGNHQFAQTQILPTRQCNIKGKSTLVLKMYERAWHLNISKLSVHLVLCALDMLFISISVNFYCYTSSFVPNIEAKSVVLELKTRDSDHCCWFLLV